jgi:hypothetical protein
VEKVRRNFESLEARFTRLKNSVEHRIRLAADYLTLVKKVSQFRSVVLDLQELFKNLDVNGSGEGIFEAHVQEKMQAFEQVYRELTASGQRLLEVLRRADNEILKLNTNHLMSDIEMFLGRVLLFGFGFSKRRKCFWRKTGEDDDLRVFENSIFPAYLPGKIK